ncbi:redoxin domain-containing protein [Halorarum halobium]|uniref:redoxin domain-containing protein n=1 Tax=Halorarum halobium TaxID=3075121 RepID=UPI0028B225D5|nr:redoxin domain-containing protein [Halobaculum sp. XH14]
MLETGDTAPDVTAPMATPEAAETAERGAYTGEHVAEFDLDRAAADGPVVLAFYPGVYSRTCTAELCAYRDWRDDLAESSVDVYGVSVDTPWSLLAFVDEYDLGYPLVSGFNNSIVREFGVERGGGLLSGISDRAAFVVDDDRQVTWTWAIQESGVYPEVAELEAAVRDAP